MTSKCSICNRADRAQIDQALVSGVSLRELEARHSGTTRSALDRHRKHIPPALTRAKQAEEVADASSLLSRVNRLVSQCERLLEKAEAARKWSDAAAAAREVRGGLELLGKLSGELQTGKGATINLAVIESLNIAALTAEQVAAIYDRIQSERLSDVSRMSDEELIERLAEFGFRVGGTTVKEAPLFDEETVPPGLSGNHTGWRSSFGERKWSPYRNSTPSDRFRMLQVAWKRVSGCELPEKIREQDLGEGAAIAIEFDLDDPREESWLTWPTVRLVTVSRDLRENERSALPRTIDGA